MNTLARTRFHLKRILLNRSTIIVLIALFCISILGMVLRLGLSDMGLAMPTSENSMISFRIWRFGIFFVCLYMASGFMHKEIRSRTFTPTMVRPMGFASYQWMHFLSIMGTYVIVMCMALVLIVGKSIVYKAALPDGFAMVTLTSVVDDACLIAVMIALASVVSKSLALFLFLGCAILQGIFFNLSSNEQAAIQVIHWVLYMITPLQRTLEANQGVFEDLSNVWIFVRETVTRIGYAFVCVVLSNVYYTKKDFPVRSES